MTLQFTVQKTTPSLYLYLEPIKDSFFVKNGSQVQETRASIRRLGDLPSRNSRLVATHQLGTDVITTEEVCPFSDEELVRLFSSWYDYRSVPISADADLYDPRQRAVEGGYTSHSLERLQNWATPFRVEP